MNPPQNLLFFLLTRYQEGKPYKLRKPSQRIRKSYRSYETLIGPIRKHIKQRIDFSLLNFDLMGIFFNNCGEWLEDKTDGAQEPECTYRYMRIPSTAQRSYQGTQQISGGTLQ